MTATTVAPAASATGRWALKRTAGIWFFVAAAVVVPLSLYEATTKSASSDLTVLLLQELIIVYASGRLALVTVTGRRHPMQLGFWLFVYVWLGLAGLLQEAAGTNPFLFLQGAGARTAASIIVLAGLVAYDAGCALASRRSAPALGVGDRPISLSRTRLIVLASVLSLPFLIPKLGGLEALFSSRSAVGQSLINQGLLTSDSKVQVGIYTALAEVPPLLGFLILLRNRSRTLAGALILIVIIGVNVVVNNPISTPRFWFGTLCFALLYSSPRLRRPVVWKLLPAALGVVLIVVFPYADLYRYAPNTQNVGSFGIIDSITVKGDYDASAQVVNAAAYVSARGNTDGHQLEGALLFWLPRSIWSDKALDTGTVIGQYINFQDLNLSCPLWAEGYVDFGWLGTVMLLGLLGYFARRADGAYERHLDGHAGATLAGVIVPVLAGYELLVLRGSLLEAMGRLAALLVLALLLSRSPRSQSDPIVSGALSSNTGRQRIAASEAPVT